MIVDQNPFTGNNRTRGGLNVQEFSQWTTLRASALRVDPQTEHQQILQKRCIRISAHWTQILNPSQQTAWSTYALLTPYPHPTKGVVFLTAPAIFRAANLPRLAGGLTIISVAPVGAGLANYVDPTFAILPDNSVNVTIDDTDLWATVPGGVMNVAIGNPVQAGTRNQSHSYRSLGTILGAAGPPIGNLHNLQNPFVNPNIHTQWFGWHITDHNGRPGPAE